MSDPIQQIVILTGCTHETAVETYERFKDVVLAVDSLLMPPVVSGAKYIPPPTKINNGLTPEQEKICLRGRMVTDTINAATHSAYHSANRQAETVSPEQPVQTAPLAVRDAPDVESS